MRSIFESAHDILKEGAYTPEQLSALTKVMLSMKASYGDINDVRDLLKKNKNALGDSFIGIVSIIAGNASLFNAFVSEFKKNLGISEDVEVIEEETLSEESLTKLKNDVLSLKRIGWSLEKVTKFLITKDYGAKLTADMIGAIHSPPKAKAPKAPREPKPKKVSWPKNPPMSKINDPQHAEKFLNQVIDSGESPDITGTEAFEVLRQAGYKETAIMWVIRNMGWEADLRRGEGGTKIAKKKPRNMTSN